MSASTTCSNSSIDHATTNPRGNPRRPGGGWTPSAIAPAQQQQAAAAARPAEQQQQADAGAPAQQQQQAAAALAPAQQQQAATAARPAEQQQQAAAPARTAGACVHCGSRDHSKKSSKPLTGNDYDLDDTHNRIGTTVELSARVSSQLVRVSTSGMATEKATLQEATVEEYAEYIQIYENFFRHHTVA